jgi:autotransporter translocation and assembly factor TamB
VRGTVDRPILSGEISVHDGSLKVDEIMDYVFAKPYAMKTEAGPTLDVLAALSPWDRLGLDVHLHIPNTFRLTGGDVQVSPGMSIGLGDINLRAGGDVSLRKAAGEPVAPYGSLDSINGTVTFQSREFRVAPNSMIVFRGELSPEVNVTVDRLISGVLVHVTISGPLSRPELALASTPPLDSSNVLALVVFGVPVNQLGVGQQQELALRAGTLAAGFLATPLVSAVQRSLGLETLRIEPSGTVGGGPRLTIAEQLAPGLTAELTREFGTQPFEEVTIEYYLSRVLRIRVRFSNAGAAIPPQFYWMERAGIDLVFFFAF